MSLAAAAAIMSVSLTPARAGGASRDGAIPAKEDDRWAPIDYGFGPGVPRPPATATAASTSGPAPIPPGGSAAASAGMFGAPVTWPIIPIHVLLLPDGRVLNYGTDTTGAQGALLVYDVWDPTLGTAMAAHLVLPNTTPTDIFCSGQSIMWQVGDVLITGGDLTIKGQRNYVRNDTTIFSPTANVLSENAPMAYARWYGSLVSLPDGRLIVFGGREDKIPTPASTPEIYDPAAGWQTLPGAASDLAFGIGAGSAWYYPRSYVIPGGLVFVLGFDGNMFTVDPTGSGAITQLPVKTLPSIHTLATVSFAPGKLLSLRTNANAIIVDATQQPPLVTQIGNIDQTRQWGNATVLADGQVLVTGGSVVGNVLKGVAYQSEIWDPGTGLWSVGASATIPRLYHSTALLLPDGSVLTAGGGAPGPLKNLNAEIYYPRYLYLNDGSGQPAPRPSLSGTPSSLAVGQLLTAMAGPADQIARMTLVRTGSATHANNSDQRFIDLVGFQQTGLLLTATLPSDPTILLPGYYMLFVFNQSGTPSIASIVLITA